MNDKKRVGAFPTKTIIFLVYLSILSLFLYAPCAYEFFSTPERSLNLYTFRSTICPEVIREFEQKTGIVVRMSYYDTNEELLAKFKVSRGKGYDLIFPSDYMVELLREDDLLQPIDHKKIANVSQLDSRLLNRYFDPENRYSLPVAWSVYGIGFDKNMIDIDAKYGWRSIFELGNKKQKISMINDAREALFLGAIYLFGKVDALVDSQIDQVQELLVKQKEFIEAYTESGAKFLLSSKIVPIAVMPASRAKELIDEHDIDRYGFILPAQGSLLDIINVAIPVVSKKSALAHKLINFLLSKHVGARTFKILSSNPANRESYKMIDKKYCDDRSFFPDDKAFKKLHSIHNRIPMRRIEKLWFSVKSA
ncbi:spermidine/putrescine ABC transporter substrate-binding protein [Candidatus Babeliales bacterium]|nr:spermidine/putrescine ABC transporter substrate-binding protein [Candidatus Babeliales bacterium]